MGSDGGRVIHELEICHRHMPITDTDRGEVLCRECGMVITDRLEDMQHDLYSDPRGSRNSSRTGPAISLTMHDGGLYTTIGNNTDSTGRRIRNKSRFDRIRMWDQRAKSVPRTRNLGAALTFLHGLRAKLAIPENVAEEAAYHYRKALDMGLVRGRSSSPILLACLYAACRESSTPRSLDDLSTAGNVKKTALSRALRLVVQNLELKLEPYDVSTFTARLANNLNLGEKIKRDAFQIISRARVLRIIEGKNPVAFAAGALYLAAIKNSHPLTQGMMVAASGISSVTIRNTSGMIRRAIGV